LSDVVDTDPMSWFRDVVVKEHPTREALLKFLYNCKWPYGAEAEAIEFVEKNKDDSPITLWCKYRTWIKILYSVSLTIESKATGKVTFYHPGGAHVLVWSYFKGNYIIK